MATIRSLNVLLRANTREFDGKLDRSKRKMSGFQSALHGFARSAASVAAGLGIAFAAREVVNLGRNAVGAFMRQEEAVNNLSAAMRLAGDSSAASLNDMKAFAAEIQSMTTIGDEAVMEIAALGASMGQLTGDALKEATTAAIGLSKAFGMDTTAAMRLVARAAQGDTASLTRYGIRLDETLTAQEKFNEVLAIGNRNFGLAQAEIDTAAGKWQQFKNSLGDFMERVGGGMVNLFTGIIDTFRFWAENIDTIIDKLGVLGDTLSWLVSTPWEITVKISRAFTEWTTPPVEAPPTMDRSVTAALETNQAVLRDLTRQFEEAKRSLESVETQAGASAIREQIADLQSQAAMVQFEWAPFTGFQEEIDTQMLALEIQDLQFEISRWADESSDLIDALPAFEISEIAGTLEPISELPETLPEAIRRAEFGVTDTTRLNIPALSMQLDVQAQQLDVLNAINMGIGNLVAVSVPPLG